MLLNTSVAMLLGFRHVLGPAHAVERSTRFKAMLERVKVDTDAIADLKEVMIETPNVVHFR